MELGSHVRRSLALRGLTLALGVSGCSLEQGFKDTSDALSPDDTLYIDGPGYQILPGKFQSLDYQSDLMFARRVEGQPSDLVVVDPQRQALCDLPGAASYRHWLPPWIAYHSEFDGNGFGLLKFATSNCEPLDTTVEGARLPFDITEAGEAVLRVGSGIAKVDPLTGESSSIVEDFSNIRLLSFRASSDQEANYLWLIEKNGGVTGYNAEWQQLDSFGREIRHLSPLSDSTLLIEDADGLSILTASEGAQLKLTPLASDACQATAGKWITYFSPCEEQRLVTRSSSRGPFQFDVSVAPGLTRFISFADETEPGGFRDRLYYLQDIDPNTGLGSIYVTEPTRELSDGGQSVSEPKLVAEQADLGWLSVQVEGAYVLANVQDGVGSFVFVDKNLVSHELVTSVPRQIPSGVKYGADGFVLSKGEGVAGTGDLMEVDRVPNGAGGGIPTVRLAASGVPLDGGFSAETGVGSAVLQDYDGLKGRLAMVTGERAGQSAGTGVPKYGFVPLTGFGLPGVAFFSNYDFDKGVGDLEYWNVEIDARGIVAQNVSEFMLVPWPHAGVVYAVQNGDQSGVWFARAK